MYTMKQVLYPGDMDRVINFYDGEAWVINDVITFDREHWKDQLYQMGFVEVVGEPEETSATPVQEVAFPDDEPLVAFPDGPFTDDEPMVAFPDEEPKKVEVKEEPKKRGRPRKEAF